MRGSSDSPISVVVLDPHREQRERIRHLLNAERDLDVVAVGSSREHGSELFWELWPDAAVIDVGLLSACEYPLHGWGSIPGHVRLIAVGAGEDPWTWSRLRAAGFSAYLPQDRLDDELCDALREAVDAGRAALRPTGRFSRPSCPTPPVLASAGRDTARFSAPRA